MVALVLTLIRLAVASKWVEYKFGLEYGDNIYDYSGNGRDGTNGALNSDDKAKMTDRGMYFDGGKVHIDVPEKYSGPYLGTFFSVVLWTMPKDEDGIIFRRGPGSINNNFLITRDKAKSSVDFEINYSGSLSTTCSNYDVGTWTLLILIYQNKEFQLLTQNCQSSKVSKSYVEQGNNYFTYLGSPYSTAFKGFIWYFLIIQSVESLDTYRSSGSYTTCSLGPCTTCENAVIDPDYGTVCLSQVTDPSMNSYSKSCSSTYGCTLTSTYSCSCSYTCLYNQITRKCSCIDKYGTTSSINCKCQSGYYIKSNLCCNTKCSACSSSSTCTSCNDANAEVVSGGCSCKSGYFLSSTSSTTSYCSKCKTNCESCTSSSDCSSCFDSNAEVVSNACVCKAAHYGSPSSDYTSSCFPCSTGCSTCTAAACQSCYDSNAEASGSDCKCKAGYFGSPSSSVSSSTCYPCTSKCSVCDSATTCTECFDQYAEFINGECVCKSGYFGVASTDNSVGCQACKAMCSSCTTTSDCLSCFDQNSEVSQNSCVCKTAHYGSPSSSSVSTCYPCESKCSACTSNECLSCYDENAKVNGKDCECKSGYFGTPAENSLATNCFACPDKCSVCDSASTCTTCFDQYAEFVNSECICKTGYFGIASSDGSPGCSSCKLKCSSCTSSNDCSSCYDANSEVVNDECVCKNGYFSSISNGSSSCLACPTGCKECTSSSDCSTCFDDNASFDGTSCVCNQGYFGTTAQTYEQTCFACPAKCKVCTSSTDCSTCFDSNASFDSGSCACKSKYYGEASSDSTSESGCFHCLSDCASCDSGQDCSSCLDSNAEVINGLCECKMGFYGTPYDGSSTGCQSCLVGCKTCTSGLDCSECFDPSAEIKNNECVCKSGFYGNVVDSGTSCFACKSGCSSCTDSSDCLECFDQNSLITENLCQCKSGYFQQPDNITCEACKDDCSKCSSKNNCQSCSDPNAISINGLCTCLKGYFKLGSSCEACSNECETCSSLEKCLTCTSKNAKPDNSSKCSCTSGFFNTSLLISELSCIPCPSECLECESSSFCKICKSKNALLSNSRECICGEGFFNTSSLSSEDSCKKCNFSCKTCSDLKTCTECFGKNTVLVDGKCRCKEKFYLNDSQLDCLPCPGSTIEGKCKAFCPEGEGWVRGACVRCPDLCIECDSKSNCLKCVENSSLQNGSCFCFKGFQSSDGICDPAYFYFSFTEVKKKILKIRFTDEPLESLSQKDFSLNVDGTSTRFELKQISKMVYFVLLDQNLELNETNDLVIFINKSPLISTENSQLHKYSASLIIQNNKVTEEDVSSVSQGLASFAMGSAATANPGSCWMLINTLQMISYLPFNSVPYTENLQDFSSSLSNYNILPNILSMTLDHESTSDPYQPAKYCNFKSSVFWVNFGTFFTVFVICLGILPFLYLGLHLNLTKRISFNLIQQYKFSFFIRFWLVAYIPVGIYSFIQLNSEIKNPISGYVNFVSAGFFLVLFIQAAVIFTPFGLLFFLYRKKNLLQNKDFRLKFSSLFEELKEDPDLASLMYYPIITLRKLLFITIQCVLWKSPGSQSALNSFLTLTHAGYLIYFRPLKSFLPLLSEILGQVCVFICIISTTFLYDDKNLFSVKDIEDSFKYTVFVTISLQTGLCFYYSFKFFLNLWKKYRSQSQAFKQSSTISSQREPELTIIHGRSSSRGLIIEKDENL